jgi:hypothetical protein
MLRGHVEGELSLCGWELAMRILRFRAPRQPFHLQSDPEPASPF